MSCPLLDKLAPETRVQIYEYILCFDAPLRHATRMEPFARRCFTADDHNWSKLLSMSERLDRDLESDEDSDESKVSGEPVDTAILVAKKVIYNEAVQVFYDMNTICIEPQLASLRNFSALRTTDLSLAKHVICRLQASGCNSELVKNMAKTLNLTQFIAFRFAPENFPRVRKCTLYIYFSSLAAPVWSFYHTHGALSKIDGVSNCRFAKVGSVVASFDSRPELEIIAQCEAMVRHWAECSLDPIPDKHSDTPSLSANALRRFNNANPEHSRIDGTNVVLHRVIEGACMLHLVGKSPPGGRRRVPCKWK